MGYDRGDSFPFNFEPNGTQFGSKSKEKLSPRSYPIESERKGKYSFLSVVRPLAFCKKSAQKWHSSPTNLLKNKQIKNNLSCL